jgi:hypothetical protein
MDERKQEIESDYAKVKEFLAFFFERYFKTVSLRPDQHPIAVLEAFEKVSVKKANAGLRMAINDCMEMAGDFGNAEVESLDSELRSHGIVTLSELRRRYSKGYAKIIKRGVIRNESEYYLIQNVLNDRSEKSGEEYECLEKLIAGYESP